MSEPTPGWSVPNLSPRQWQLLDIIQTFIDCHHYPPTIRELEFLAGYESTSAVHFQLKRLVLLGVISRDPKIARSISITAGVLHACP